MTVRYRAGLLDTAGNAAHAASYIRDGLIVLDKGLRGDPQEHARILCHERFHFVWARLGNPVRWSWEDLLRREGSARGEAGWSAEWRRRDLKPSDSMDRTRRWREYCCESFCDTAAWVFTGAENEVTLAKRHLRARKLWFSRYNWKQ
jgi:hypothetical protein